MVKRTKTRGNVHDRDTNLQQALDKLWSMDHQNTEEINICAIATEYGVSVTTLRRLYNQNAITVPKRGRKTCLTDGEEDSRRKSEQNCKPAERRNRKKMEKHRNDLLKARNKTKEANKEMTQLKRRLNKLEKFALNATALLETQFEVQRISNIYKDQGEMGAEAFKQHIAEENIDLQKMTRAASTIRRLGIKYFS